MQILFIYYILVELFYRFSENFNTSLHLHFADDENDPGQMTLQSINKNNLPNQSTDRCVISEKNMTYADDVKVWPPKMDFYSIL